MPAIDSSLVGPTCAAPSGCRTISAGIVGVYIRPEQGHDAGSGEHPIPRRGLLLAQGLSSRLPVDGCAAIRRRRARGASADMRSRLPNSEAVAHYVASSPACSADDFALRGLAVGHIADHDNSTNFGFFTAQVQSRFGVDQFLAA